MIVNFEDLGTIRENHSSDTIVLAGGCFDLMHEGHISGMEFCKALGDILVVGVSSDARIKQRKGPTRPIRNEVSRLALINAIKPVDYSFVMPMPNESDTPTIQVIKKLRPDIFSDGEENRERWLDSIPLLEMLGTKLVINNTVRLDSTTSIIERAILSYIRSDSYRGHSYS